jgi:Ni,Fe-hydrogenase I cytochrome b subunit
MLLRKDHVPTWLWIVIIVIVVLAVLGYFGRGRFTR